MLFFAPKLVDAIMSGDAVDSAAARHLASRALLAAAPPASAAGARAALLTAVPFVLSAAGALYVGKRSQEKGERFRHLAIPWFASSALFFFFSSAATVSPRWGFACLTLAVVGGTAPSALLNTIAASASQGPAQSVAMSVYNAVSNVGGLIGPMFIGLVVHHTGVYTIAMHGLGLLLAVAASLVWYMQRWGL